MQDIGPTFILHIYLMLAVDEDTAYHNPPSRPIIST